MSQPYVIFKIMNHKVVTKKNHKKCNLRDEGHAHYRARLIDARKWGIDGSS